MKDDRISCIIGGAKAYRPGARRSEVLRHAPGSRLCTSKDTPRVLVTRAIADGAEAHSDIAPSKFSLSTLRRPLPLPRTRVLEKQRRKANRVDSSRRGGSAFEGQSVGPVLTSGGMGL